MPMNIRYSGGFRGYILFRRYKDADQYNKYIIKY